MRIRPRLDRLVERLRSGQFPCPACEDAGPIEIVEVYARADGTRDKPGRPNPCEHCGSSRIRAIEIVRPYAPPGSPTNSQPTEAAPALANGDGP